MWTSLFTSVFLATSVTVSYATGNGDLPSVKLGVTDILGTLRGSNNVPVEFYGGSILLSLIIP
jgi:hypothetical protein